MYFKELTNLCSGGRDTAGVHGPARGLRLLAPGGTSLQPRGPTQPPHRVKVPILYSTVDNHPRMPTAFIFIKYVSRSEWLT